jgi:hyperosmotically inducible periplasmic protein
MSTPTMSVTERIQDALAEDSRTRAEVIEVTSQAGVVTLAGEVKSDQIRRAAEEIARSQPGVITLVNEIKVR